MLSETRLRLDAIHFVRALRERWVAVPAAELRRFRIHLKGQQGIFKPAGLSDPLSMATTIASSYTHDTIEGSCVYYDFVPRSREHENEGLKRCAEAAVPLIYFLQVKRGRRSTSSSRRSTSSAGTTSGGASSSTSPS